MEANKIPELFLKLELAFQDQIIALQNQKAVLAEFRAYWTALAHAKPECSAPAVVATS